MFILTSDIRIGDYRAIKPNRVEWKSSVGTFTDTCTITLPLAPFTRRTQTTTEQTDGVAEMTQGSRIADFKQVPFHRGDKVFVSLGYDGRNVEVFRGYVLRINYTDQLIIECDGYSYPLRDLYFSRSYQTTTLRKILQDLTTGTDIRLSPAIADIPLQNVWFKNATGLKVLEWVRKELCCQVWFDGEYLYAGASKFVCPDPTRTASDIRLQIGYNVVSADDLKKQEAQEVQINIVVKDTQGQIKRTKSESKKYSNIKEIKVRPGLPQSFLQQAVRELQADQDYRGYEGSITCFGEPHIFKSDKLIIADNRFPERSGNYFAESVEGEYGENGIRQTIKMKHYGNG